MAENLGASFTIDVTNLKAGLAQANRLIRESESEFKAAAAGMDDWSNSEEGLTKKIKSLNDIAGVQQKKVDALQEEYDRLISEGLDPAGAKATDLRTKINNETAALNRSKAEIEKQTKALEELENATDDAADSTKEAEEAAEKLGDGFSVAKGALATFIGNGLTKLTEGLGNAISSLAGLADETREYREDIGKLETAFSDANVSVETAKDTYKDFYSVLGEEDRSVEAINHLAKFVDTEEDMAKWTNICTGVWGTFGDSLPIEGLTEASNETMKTGKLTGVLADALNWAGVNEDDFQASLDKCNSEQERQALITDTLNGLYSDAADSYKENNKEIIEARKASSDYTDSMAELGETVEPITTTVREGLTELVGAMTDLVKKADFSKIQSGIKKGFNYLIDTVLPKVVDGFNWIIDHKDGLIAGIAGIGAAFAAFKAVTIIQTAITAFQGLAAVIQLVGVKQAALNLIMSMNPIGLIVAAIAGLVAAFVVLWKKSDSFRNFWINLWETIKEKTAAVFEAIKGFFTTVWEVLQPVVEKIKEVLGAAIAEVSEMLTLAWETIKAVWDLVQPYFAAIWENIKAIFSVVVEVLGGYFSVAWEVIKAVWDVAVQYFTLIWENIKVVFSAVKNTLAGFFEAAWTSIKAVWDVVAGYFKMVWDNIKLIFSVVKSVLTGDFKGAWEGIKGIWNNVKGYFETVWNSIKTIFSAVTGFFKTAFSEAWEAIKGVFSNVGKFFGGIWDTIKEKFTTIGTKIGDAIGGAFKSAINAVIATVENGLNFIPNAVNKVLDKINELPGVDIGEIPTVSLPRLAKGGVVRKATSAIIGEDGAEAVMPLERNTGWIDELAGKISEKVGSGVTVNQTNNYSQAHSRYELYKSQQATTAAVKLALMR